MNSCFSFKINMSIPLACSYKYLIRVCQNTSNKHDRNIFIYLYLVTQFIYEFIFNENFII